MILGCNSKNQKIDLTVKNSQEVKVDSIVNKANIISTENKAVKPTPTNCNCESVKYIRSYSTDLIFQNGKHAKAKNEERYSTWSQDSLVEKVTSIRFSGFDTIPNKYSIFSNVERLSIENRNGIYGLDIFPKLKSIHFFGSVINLNTKEQWLNQLEVLIGQKTKFLGLESFRKTPNLKVIYMGYSGFDTFPKDLDYLDCLNELTLGAYLHGEVDLSQLDLSKNECLKKVEFQTWYNSLSGIPKGILASKIEAMKINHQKLTELEKEDLKKIKSQLVKNRSNNVN